jgi:hypothetical protein
MALFSKPKRKFWFSSISARQPIKQAVNPKTKTAAYQTALKTLKGAEDEQILVEYLNQAGFEIGSHTRSHFDGGSSDVQALQLDRLSYPCVCSPFGGGNFPSRDDQLWHLRRASPPHDIWELELALQSVLDF